jgi:hypothetical protein
MGRGNRKDPVVLQQPPHRVAVSGEEMLARLLYLC